MPELPDVEGLARALRPIVVGRRIGRVRILNPATVRSPSARAFARLVRGHRIEGIGRRGKYLLIELSGGLLLVVHLRMTGDLPVVSRRAPLHPHTRVVFSINGRELRFVDQRRFGHMDVVPAHRLHSLPGLRRLGIEPLGRAFTLEKFRALLRGRRGALKGLLLRQDLVAGIGNLYADEILFQAGLSPGRRTDSLRPSEAARLHRAIRAVLRRATARSRPGRPAGALLDSRVPGGPCPRCGRPLAAVRIGGRSTYYCRTCQR